MRDHSHDPARPAADGHSHSHAHDEPHAHATPSRRALIASGLALGASASMAPLAWAAPPQVGHDMARAATAWLDTLDARQKSHYQGAH